MNNIRRQNLDIKLREHTEGEENNLKGHPTNFLNSLNNDPRTHKRQQIVFPHLTGIWINKNSRFRTIENHNHNYIEIEYVYSGQAHETVNDQNFTLSKGQLILIDTNTAHSIGYTDENDILINIIAGSEIFHEVMNEFKTDNILIQFLLNALSNNNNSCNFLIFNTLNNDRLEDLILELIYEHCFPTANFQEIMQSLFRSILLDMMPAVDTDISFQSLGKASGTVVGALAYINEHYLDCSLDSTAEFIGVNSSYLSSLIKKQTSKNFKDIVSEKKLEKACRLLLTTEISIDQIAEQSGYQNLTFFYKKFSDIHHCTPKKYRTQYSVHNDRI